MTDRIKVTVPYSRYATEIHPWIIRNCMGPFWTNYSALEDREWEHDHYGPDGTWAPPLTIEFSHASDAMLCKLTFGGSL